MDEINASAQTADAYCAQLFDCKCVDSAGFGSEEACFATVNMQLGVQQADAIRAALIYDAGCVAEAVDDLQAFACSRDPDEVPTCNDCFAYHGLAAENEPCERIGAFSTCNQGLECVPRESYEDGMIDVCARACVRVAAHEACALEGPGFQIRYDCEEGSVCDFEASGYCLPLPGPGDACASGSICGPDAWCDTGNDPPICASPKAIGDGCETDLECASTWCRTATRCAQPLERGAFCVPTEDRCDVGLTCPPDQATCVPTDALVCQLPPIGL